MDNTPVLGKPSAWLYVGLTIRFTSISHNTIKAKHKRQTLDMLERFILFLFTSPIRATHPSSPSLPATSLCLLITKFLLILTHLALPLLLMIYEVDFAILASLGLLTPVGPEHDYVSAGESVVVSPTHLACYPAEPG